MTNVVYPRPESVAMISVGGENFPMRSSATCHTCQSPHRMFIENQLVRGRGYAAIAREIAEMTPGPLPHPTARTLADHVKNGHLPSPALTRRRIIENRAQEIGVNILGEDDLIDHVSFARLTLQRTQERILKGEIDPSVADGLNAAKFLHQVEATSPEGYDHESYEVAFRIFFETAQNYMSGADFQAFTGALSRDPILQALAAKQSGQTVEGEVDDDYRDENISV